MKRVSTLPFLLLLLILWPSGAAARSCDCFGSRSFFRPRSILETADLYLALNEYNFYKHYFASGAKLQRNYLAAGLFYERSTKSNRLARYFLPNNNCQVTIKEDGTGDIGSLWLKVIAPIGLQYSSVLTLCPQRSIWGGYIDYRHRFNCVANGWFDIRAAAYQARHQLCPKEVAADNAALGTLPGIQFALDYLSSTELAFGRISRCTLKKGGIDDIELRFGYDFYRCDDRGYYASLFASVLVPTARRPKAVYLFEPLIGRGHWGLGGGLKAGASIMECDSHVLAVMTELSYQFLFKRNELRSFDLCNRGQWSRYLRVARASAPAVSFPAINFTTLCATVTPRSVINWWTALHYTYCNWHAEFGYNLWWRQAEKICLDSCARACFNKENVGIFGMGNVCTPTSASTATISQGKTFSGTGNVVVNDTVFTPLTSNDLDLCSATHPSVLTNKIYAAIARDMSCRCYEVNLGLGASYEISRCARAINQWGVWGNVGVNF